MDIKELVRLFRNPFPTGDSVMDAELLPLLTSTGNRIANRVLEYYMIELDEV